MAELYNDIEGLEILGVWANFPDIATYFEIFDDYLDFKILPWDSTGYDDGEMIPERKNALRLLMTGIQEFEATRGGRSQPPPPNANQRGAQGQDLNPDIFGKVVESKGSFQGKGGKIVDTESREVVMRAPQKEDLEDWHWEKFAYPDDIEAYKKLKEQGRV